MKVGPYCNYSLEEIIKIKQEEESKCGKFFWGYGGVFCRPNLINTFVSIAQENNVKPIVLFSKTLSAYESKESGRFSQFSKDKSKWEALPSEVLLVGKQNASHFAIVAQNLKKVDITLNLSDYCSFIGMFPDPNKYLDEYFRYRVDKACGFYLPKGNKNQRHIKIEYTCELIEPYCVFVK